MITSINTQHIEDISEINENNLYQVFKQVLMVYLILKRVTNWKVDTNEKILVKNTPPRGLRR